MELNFTSQFARYLRSETGINMDAHVNKYDGEPFEPNFVVTAIKNIVANKNHRPLQVTEGEAIEIAYHYLRTHYQERMRPDKASLESKNGKGETVWRIELTERASGNKSGEMTIGAETGATYSFEPAPEPVTA